MMKDRLFRQILQATAPLILWALHFSVCYGVVAALCSPALVGPGMPVLWLPWLATALALAGCGYLLWRSRAALTPGAGLVPLASAAGAVLALAGIGWTTLPLLLLGGCG